MRYNCDSQIRVRGQRAILHTTLIPEFELVTKNNIRYDYDSQIQIRGDRSILDATMIPKFEFVVNDPY